MMSLSPITLPSFSRCQLFFEEYPHHRRCPKCNDLYHLPEKKSLLLGEGGTPKACRMRGHFSLISQLALTASPEGSLNILLGMREIE